MRAKKLVIKISCIMISIGVIVYTIALVFSDCGKLPEWIKTIFSGVVASAIVSLLISIGEYQIAKRQTIEAFVTETRAILHQLRMDYLYPDTLVTDKEVEEIKQIVHKVEEQCDEAFKTVSTRHLSDIYGDIDFITSKSNKNVREELIFSQIYSRVTEVTDGLKELNFRLHDGRPGTIHTLVDYIVEFQKLLFSTESRDGKTIVYRCLEYDVETSIHELLTYLYGEKLYKEQKPETKEFVHCYRFGG